MGNNIQIFSSDQFGQIRTSGTGEHPLFCLADVCKALDLRQGDVNQRLDKGVVSTQPLMTKGGIQQANFVNEDGLYDVILDSRKPEAKQFRKWVTSEVLPSIRKNGAYLYPQKIEDVLFNPDLIIELATNLKKERQEKELLQLQNENQNQRLTDQAPKVEYYENTLMSTNTMTTTQIAKELGMSAVVLNKKLHELGIQYKVGEQWVLYAKYQDRDYAKTSTYTEIHNGESRTYVSTVWTQKGRMFIHGLLKMSKIA